MRVKNTGPARDIAVDGGLVPAAAGETVDVPDAVAKGLAKQDGWELAGTPKDRKQKNTPEPGPTPEDDQ